MISKVARSFEGYKEEEVHVHMYKLLSLMS